MLLMLETVEDKVFVAPVLVRHANEQRTSFDGEDGHVFPQRRGQEIGCSSGLTEKAKYGSAPPLDVNGAVHLAGG